ncbi:hypothetical protein BH20ACT9_BH20ACT9_11450 [soil metagenome]
MARLYARIVGVVVLLLGVLGLLLGDESLLGLINIDLFEDGVHLVTGGALTYVGFAGRDHVVTGVVGALGAVYLVVGVLGFVLPDLFGLLPHEYSAFDNVLHLALGGLGLAAVAASRRTTAPA